jgi:hypothetical protein
MKISKARMDAATQAYLDAARLLAQTVRRVPKSQRNPNYENAMPALNSAGHIFIKADAKCRAAWAPWIRAQSINLALQLPFFEMCALSDCLVSSTPE